VKLRNDNDKSQAYKGLLYTEKDKEGINTEKRRHRIENKLQNGRLHGQLQRVISLIASRL
jgi:hypothetical protein